MQADVNGPETQPIWAYLKENAEEPVTDIDWVSCKVPGLDRTRTRRAEMRWRQRRVGERGMSQAIANRTELFQVLDQGRQDQVVSCPDYQGGTYLSLSFAASPSNLTRRAKEADVAVRCRGCPVERKRSARDANMSRSSLACGLFCCFFGGEFETARGGEPSERYEYRTSMAAA